MPRDYIFRYKLDPETEKAPVYHQRVTELVRAVLDSLLNVVMPLKRSQDVKVDGFRWLMDREKVYEVFPEADSHTPRGKGDEGSGQRGGGERNGFQSPSNAAFYEPRIALIGQVLESLLSVVDLEHEGQVVKVDGFRLKDPGDWLVPSGGDPAEVFEYAGGRCTCDCVFCCNKGNPASVAPCDSPNRAHEAEWQEMRTRAAYFSPQAKSALFPSLGCVYEVTANPYLTDVLRLLRDKTFRPFRITTNGTSLTTEKVAELAGLQPVYVYLSLNSSSTLRRRRLMRDPGPDTAISALPLLQQHGIPYAVVIVPWPVDTVEEMLEDLSSTVSYAAQHEAHLIQVNLPGYSSYLSGAPPFDLHQVWQAVVCRVRELREKHDCPVIAMPTMYEENMYHPRKNVPQLIGLVKNSPAYLGGLQRGDVVLQVGGIAARDRPQARDLLSLVRQSGAKEVSLTVHRNNRAVETRLDLARHSYPYSRDTDMHLGIIFMGSGLRMSYVERLKEIVESYQAKRVLFLSSELVKPAFEQCLAESRLLGDSQLDMDIEVPRNKFFGGNILMGDLLVVQDFIDCVKDYVARKGRKPEVVVIPSSPFNLSGWGRDLTGRVYLDIERETGIPVELLHCATTYD